MRKIKVLNLYAGLGGNRKLWTGCDVTAVELDQKIAKAYRNLHPDDDVIIADAHQYLLDNHHNFDFVWSSPPCQTHSKMAKATRHKLNRYVDMSLYQEILFLNNFFKGKFIVENVVPHYKPLIDPSVKVGRHLFWSNFQFFADEVKQPKGFISMCNLNGKKAMQDWLGLHYEENIYYGNNHCPAQILRNCVHPELGLQIYKQAFQPA